MTTYDKVLRESLGLPATATDREVALACAKRPTHEVCNALSCRCAEVLSEGAPGLTADVPMELLAVPEDMPFGITQPPRCCLGSDEKCGDSLAAIAALQKGARKRKP